MIFQESGEFEGHFDEKSPMDWCQDPDEFRHQPIAVDPPALPSRDDCRLKETSSYGKSSYILPVSFFDIQSNIQLLNECNPLSIKVVDCDKYPWYYKKYTRPRTQSIPDNMEDTQPTNTPFVKPADVGTIKCIDLTQLTHDNPTVNNNNIKYTVNTNQSLIKHKNNVPRFIVKKKESQKLANNLTKEDLEKQKARSQVNLSRIDLKHNTGLVGLKITQAVGFNHMPFKKKKKKRKNKKQENDQKIKNNVPININKNKPDECFSIASGVLGPLGTEIIPITNQEKSHNFTPQNNDEVKVPTQQYVQISVQKPVIPKRKKPRPNQINNQCSPIVHSILKPNTNTIENEYKEKKTSSIQKLQQHIEENVDVKQKPMVAESAKTQQVHSSGQIMHVVSSEPTGLPKDDQGKIKTEEYGTEDAILKSQSPIFPCNKQKSQSEVEKHLAINDKTYIESEKNIKSPKTAKNIDLVKSNENMILVKDWPKSPSELNYKSRNILKPEQRNCNENANVHVNVSQTQQIQTFNCNTEKTKAAQNSMPEKRITVIKAAPQMKSMKNMPEPSYLCLQTAESNVQPGQIMCHETNKDYSKVSGTYHVNNHKKMHTENTTTNNQDDTNNLGVKPLVALYQQHFVKIAPKPNLKLSTKLESKSKAPHLAKIRPPVQSVAPNVNLPKLTQLTNRQDPNVYPGNNPSPASTQNIDVNLPRQQTPTYVFSYCNANGIANSLATRPNLYSTNVNRCSTTGNRENVYNTSWDPRLHLAIPPFMYPPPLFLPPPPLPMPLDKYQHVINSLQNNISKLSEEMRTNDAKNLQNNKTFANSTIAKNTTNINKINNDHFVPRSTVASSNLNVNGLNKCPADEVKRNEQRTPPREPNLPPDTSKLNVIPAHQNQSIVKEKRPKDNLLKKEESNPKPNKPTTFGNLSIKSVLGPSELNNTPMAASRASDNNKNQDIKRNNKLLDIINKSNDKFHFNLSLPADKNNISINTSEKRPKPGPLCMKNRTGNFANKNAPKPELKLSAPTLPSQPKKGYSPPILPIPTFQTVLAQSHELDLSMRAKCKEKPIIKPVTNLHLYPAVQNRKRIPNNSAGDKDSRKRIHFDGKEANELKPVKKITLEDYKNRSFCTQDDSFGMQARKCPRKSVDSAKSVTSLADVVDKNFVYEL